MKHIFPSQSFQNWEIAAIKELEGIGSIEKLAFEKAGFKMKPYYTAANLSSIRLPALPPSVADYAGARHWVNMPKVLVENVEQANSLALHHLQNGADGIYFELNGTSAAPEVLLDQIELHYCSVSFLASSLDTTFLNSFHSYAKKKFEKDQINGNIFWDANPDIDLVFNFKDWKSFQSFGMIIDSQPKATDEIAIALNYAVDSIEKLQETGLSIEQAFEQFAFSIAIGNSILLEAIKLRVLRILWSVIANAYGVQLRKPVFIHANSPTWINPAFQPHGNLIKETYSALSAVLGGCDGLTIATEDQSHPMTIRVARNTSSVLREESFLSQVADPLAGSYFIESLSQQLAEESWSTFQAISLK